MIGEAAARIVEKKVWRALGIVCLCDGLRFVVEEREGEFVFDSHFSESMGGVVGVSGGIVRADRYERDAFWLVMAGDSKNLIANMDDIRAMPADEHYEEGPGLGQRGEGNKVSGYDIRKRKLGGRGSQRDRVE